VVVDWYVLHVVMGVVVVLGGTCKCHVCVSIYISISSSSVSSGCGSRIGSKSGSRGVRVGVASGTVMEKVVDVGIMAVSVYMSVSVVCQ
jgi:hypothetical protein